MFTDATQATPDPDVIATQLDDEAVLLHMGNPHDDTLNETGGFIWQRLEQGQTAGQIHAALEEHYDVTPDQAAQSIADLLTNLHQERLITVTTP